MRNMTLEELLTAGVGELESAGVPEAGACGWYLLQACMEQKGVSFCRSDYYLRREETAPPEICVCFQEDIERRKKRIPLEYIIGYTEFMGLRFFVNEHVLIPRQDTETLVEEVLPHCRGKRVLDLCAGSGCIGLSIGALGEPGEVVLSDISGGALRVVEKNLAFLRGAGSIPRDLAVRTVQGDLLEPVEGKFDVIVSNPPYIEREEIAELMPEVKQYEPMTALDGGPDGLDFYRRLAKETPAYLESGGMLCVEIGYNQGEEVAGLMEENAFWHVSIKKDLAGNDRVVLGWIQA